MLIWFLYSAIFIVAVLGIHLYSRIRSRSVVDKVILVFLIVVTVHVIHAAIFRDIIIGLKYMDRGAPFGLLYGPFLYYAYIFMYRGRLTAKVVAAHLIPFTLGCIAYVYFLVSYDFRMVYSKTYYTILYGVMGVSWALYPIVVILMGHKSEVSLKWIYRYAIGILLILAAFMIVLVLTYTVEREAVSAPASGFIIFFSMLLGVCVVYFYLLQQLLEPYVSKRHNLQEYVEDGSERGDGNKTLYNPIKLKNYYTKIDLYLSQERYLDPDFNITGMLQDLRIPKPVVVQYFSEVYQDSIKRAINVLRIRKACELLELEVLEYTMEELAEKCGFNSRASFYRNFSQEKSCTPLEYRDTYLLKNRHYAD